MAQQGCWDRSARFGRGVPLVRISRRPWCLSELGVAREGGREEEGEAFDATFIRPTSASTPSCRQSPFWKNYSEYYASGIGVRDLRDRIISESYNKRGEGDSRKRRGERGGQQRGGIYTGRLHGVRASASPGMSASAGKGLSDAGGGWAFGDGRTRAGMYSGTDCSWRCLERAV